MQCARKNCRNLAVDGANYCGAHLQREGLGRPGINLNQRSATTRDSARGDTGQSGKRDEPLKPAEHKTPATSRKK
jgi:hypothetical protein